MANIRTGGELISPASLKRQEEDLSSTNLEQWRYNKESLMFYCREEELKKLNKRYDNDAFECIIIYGRRRVGKTA